MLPFLTHDALGTLLCTTSSPRHTSPGGHVWQSSVSGLRMYCPATHARHSCRSSDPALRVVHVLWPAGQLVSSYRPLETPRVQLPTIRPEPEQLNCGGLCSAHDRSAHTAPVGHVTQVLAAVAAG